MTTAQIRAALDRALTQKGEEKLQALLKIHDELHREEMKAASDFGYDLFEIRTIRRILPEVETGISRIHGARKAALSRAANKKR